MSTVADVRFCHTYQLEPWGIEVIRRTIYDDDGKKCGEESDQDFFDRAQHVRTLLMKGMGLIP